MPEQIDLFGEPAAAAEPELAPEPTDDFEQALARITTLDELGEVARGCHRCRLREGCRQVVFGEGAPRAGIILVGEGPGATEDEQGRPFCGRAGELLDRILGAIGITRGEVYITNVVLCRPPGNRTPADDEIAACRPYLERRLQLTSPRICVAMGATAARVLIHPKARITQVRGQWHRRGQLWVMPTYHPAALLRDPSKKRPAWEDFQQVRDLYRRLAAPANFPTGE